MVALYAEGDPTTRVDETLRYDPTPEELAVMQHVILEKFHELSDHIPLLAVRRQAGDHREIALQPVLAIAMQTHNETEPILGELSPDMILDRIAEFFGVKSAQIRGHERQREFIRPRQLAMYLMREHTPLSLKRIAHELGGRDHTTVSYGINRIKEALDKHDEDTVRQLHAIELALKNPDAIVVGRRVIEVEKVVVLTGEGMFVCPVFVPKSSAQKLLVREHEAALEWSERISNDQLWLKYGNMAYQRLLALENEHNAQ